jgi:hypothetical protein
MGLNNAFGAITLDATTQQTNTRISALQQILQPLQRIAQLLRPLGLVSNSTGRLSVDINNVGGGTIGTVTTLNTINGGTITTVGTVSNQTLIGGANAYAQIQSVARQAYSSGIRGKIS